MNKDKKNTQPATVNGTHVERFRDTAADFFYRRGAFRDVKVSSLQLFNGSEGTFDLTVGIQSANEGTNGHVFDVDARTLARNLAAFLGARTSREFIETLAQRLGELCETCGGRGQGKGRASYLPCVTCHGSGERAS